MSAVPQLRVPPHSIEAEIALLGGLMLDNEALHQVHIEPEAFYKLLHRDIAQAVVSSQGKTFDALTIFEQLRGNGRHDADTLLPELMAIAQYRSSTKNLKRYAQIVSDKWRMRQLVSAGDEIAAMGFQDAPSTEQIDKAQMLLAKLATVKRRHEPQHITASLADYLGLLQDLSDGKNPAFSTGIGGLDRVLNGGLRRGGVMVLGARPKHGKTALALAIARHIARRHEVLYISQEMPISDLMHRHTAATGSIDLGRILAADASDTEMWDRVTDAAEKLGELHLTHDDQSAQSLMDVRRKAVQVKRQRGLDVLVVDFLQLMQGAGGDDNRNRELDVIANGIKSLALDLDVAVVLLSQMSRKADEHYGRPTMTHLRDSGAIEAAADVIALLFTDHAHPLSKKTPEFAGYSELEIVAQRNGPQGVVPLQFIGAYQQFGDWMGPRPEHKSESRKRGGDL